MALAEGRARDGSDKGREKDPDRGRDWGQSGRGYANRSGHGPQKLAFRPKYAVRPRVS